MRTSLFAAFVVSAFVAAPAGAQQITKDAVPGVTNFARLETTVACGGVIKTSAVAELKQMGFKSIFDLQLPTETGADVEGEAAAAKAAGLNFIHVPFTPASPDTSSVDKFLKEVVQPANRLEALANPMSRAYLNRNNGRAMERLQALLTAPAPTAA